MPSVRCRGYFANLPSLLLSAGLVACGGGGGSSGGSGSSGGGGGNGSFSIAPTNFELTADWRINSSLPDIMISGVVTGVTVQTLYLNVVITGDAVQGVSRIEASSASTGAAWLTVGNHHLLSPGVHRSTVIVTACTSSPACTSEPVFAGSWVRNE